jgi:type III restriction enzyme
LIDQEPISKPKVFKTRNQLTISQKDGIGKTSGSIEKVLDVERSITVPDILGELSRRVPLARSTIYRVIRDSKTEFLISENPASYMDRVRRACNNALGHTLKDKDGIVYYSVGDKWEAEVFLRQSIPESYADNLVATSKSIFDAVPCDSHVERRFAEALEADSSVKLFLKLPGWFKVPTPLGNYNPDWAVVKEEGEQLFLYMIRETKGTDDPEDLFREAEKWKVSFGSKHFEAISVDYAITSSWNSVTDNSTQMRQN